MTAASFKLFSLLNKCIHIVYIILNISYYIFPLHALHFRLNLANIIVQLIRERGRGTISSK